MAQIESEDRATSDPEARKKVLAEIKDNAIEESDMVAIPDPATFRVMPDGQTGRLICDVVTPDGEPFGGDPRHVLRLALDRMKAMGFDTFNIGPEAEYFLFEDDKGTVTLDEGGYFAQTTMDAATTIRRDTIRALEQMGICLLYTSPSPRDRQK